MTQLEITTVPIAWLEAEKDAVSSRSDQRRQPRGKRSRTQSSQVKSSQVNENGVAVLSDLIKFFSLSF